MIIPSRAQANQVPFLTRAISSIQAQQARTWLKIEVFVGIDPGAAAPALNAVDIPVEFVRAAGCSAAAALNAAASMGSGDYMALLEDDDTWCPNHLELSLRALEHCGFVSGTQLEVDPEDTVVRINDFATPASWVMRRETWDRVGPFDTTYRFHADNEWLGRLAEHRVPRIHLVESTAPLSVHVARQVRPWLANIIDLGGGHLHLERHDSPVPLVRRLVHPDAGMSRIAVEAEAKAVSDGEIARVIQRYGRIPW